MGDQLNNKPLHICATKPNLWMFVFKEYSNTYRRTTIIGESCGSGPLEQESA